jgi:hypothetical protein
MVFGILLTKEGHLGTAGLITGSTDKTAKEIV